MMRTSGMPEVRAIHLFARLSMRMRGVKPAHDG